MKLTPEEGQQRRGVEDRRAGGALEPGQWRIYAGGVAAEAGGRSFDFNKEFRGAREVSWYLLDFLVNFVNWSDF